MGTKEEKKNTFDQIAELIAVQVSGEKIKEYAEDALKRAVEDYNVKKQVETMVMPAVIKAVEEILPTPKFQAKLRKDVEKELVGILDCAVKQVCKDLMKALSK
jgi:hypothetical protein